VDRLTPFSTVGYFFSIVESVLVDLVRRRAWICGWTTMVAPAQTQRTSTGSRLGKGALEMLVMGLVLETSGDGETAA
jgi:hypothetical protein